MFVRTDGSFAALDWISDQIYLMCDCRGINPSEEEVQDIINSVDTDYSGKIEWPEFAAALAEKLKPHEDEEVSRPTRSRHRVT